MVAFAGFRTEALERHADVVFPAEAYAEKEGTMTHPDGRLQRLRQTIGRPAQVRPEWSVLLELCGRLGAPLDAWSVPALTAAVAEAVPFYAGVTLDEIGGRGVRWQDRDAASAAPQAEPPGERLDDPPPLSEGMRLGAVPSLWTGPTTEHAEALRFLVPSQQAELSPADARRLGISPGDEVVVSSNGSSVRARARLRSAIPSGSVFLIAGTAEESATAVPEGLVEVRRA